MAINEMTLLTPNPSIHTYKLITGLSLKLLWSSQSTAHTVFLVRIATIIHHRPGQEVGFLPVRYHRLLEEGVGLVFHRLEEGAGLVFHRLEEGAGFLLHRPLEVGDLVLEDCHRLEAGVDFLLHRLLEEVGDSVFRRHHHLLESIDLLLDRLETGVDFVLQHDHSLEEGVDCLPFPFLPACGA